MKHLMLFEDFSAMGNAKMDSIAYTAPKGDWDAMHSFQSRKKDGFGGKVHEKIEKKLKGCFVYTSSASAVMPSPFSVQ